MTLVLLDLSNDLKFADLRRSEHHDENELEHHLAETDISDGYLMERS